MQDYFSDANWSFSAIFNFLYSIMNEWTKLVSLVSLSSHHSSRVHMYTQIDHNVHITWHLTMNPKNRLMWTPKLVNKQKRLPIKKKKLDIGKQLVHVGYIMLVILAYEVVNVYYDTHICAYMSPCIHFSLL